MFIFVTRGSPKTVSNKEQTLGKHNFKGSLEYKKVSRDDCPQDAKCCDLWSQDTKVITIVVFFHENKVEIGPDNLALFIAYA